MASYDVECVVQVWAHSAEAAMSQVDQALAWWDEIEDGYTRWASLTDPNG